jgi:VCBS repeat-containing protein
MARRNSAPRSRLRTLGLEQLESRVVLDGNVQAVVRGGSLQITGDSKDNQILIEQTAPKSFTVSSRDGTTLINGQSSAQTFTGVKRDLSISLGRGDDVVEIAGTQSSAVVVKRKLSIDTGDGADQVLLTNVHALRLAINTGSQDDTVNIGDNGNDSGVIVTKEAVITTGNGSDDVAIANSTFKRNLTLDMGSGNDNATIQSTHFTKRSTLIGGAGTDTISRQNIQGKVKLISFEKVNNTVVTPPVASDDTATVVRSGNVSIDVAANDTSTGSTINPASISITQQPTSGTAVANSNGTVTYTNNGAAAASDSFKYTIKDQLGNVSNAATVNITVVAALAAVDDTGTVVEDAATNTATGNVLTNDTGGVGTKTVTAVNGAAASVGTTINGQFGTFNIAADGAFTYTLDNTNTTVNALNDGQTLTDPMPYTVSAGGATATGTLRITIQGHTG